MEGARNVALAPTIDDITPLGLPQMLQPGSVDQERIYPSEGTVPQPWQSDSDNRSKASKDFESEVMRRFRELERQVHHCHSALNAKLDHLCKVDSTGPMPPPFPEHPRGFTPAPPRGSSSNILDPIRPPRGSSSTGTKGFIHEDNDAPTKSTSCSSLTAPKTGSTLSLAAGAKGSVSSAESTVYNADSSMSGRSSASGLRRIESRNSDEPAQMFGGLLNRKLRSMIIWNFIENPESSVYAAAYDVFQPSFVLSTVLFTLAQTVDDFPPSRGVCFAIDFGVDVFFVLEIFVRYMVSPRGGMAFLRNPFNVVDIMAALPLAFRLATYASASVRDLDQEDILVCAILILRCLKITRRFRKIHLLIEAFKLLIEALPVLLFTLAVITLTFASMVFLFEPRANIGSLSQSIWFTVVTMTTVGYGDVTPSSTAGYCIVIMLAIASLLYMAIPLGIVGHAFTQVWLDRDRILLFNKINTLMTQCGYTAYDIPLLFAIFDSDCAGHLETVDFRKMMEHMQLGLNDKNIHDLFHETDVAGNGTVEDRELVRQVFGANHFAEVFGQASYVEKTVICACGNRCMADAAFCRKCGKSLPIDALAEEHDSAYETPMHKGRVIARQCLCGNLLIPDAMFCRKCGQSADESSVVNAKDLNQMRRKLGPRSGGSAATQPSMCRLSSSGRGRRMAARGSVNFTG